MKVLILLIILGLNGCAWLSPHRSSQPEAVISLQSGRIIDKEVLDKGRTVCIIPFSPGVNVEANANVNRSALMIVKGLSEALKERNSNLKVVFGDEAEYADLLITGRITEIKRTPFYKRWLRYPDILHMEIDAKMIDPANDRTVALFQNKKDSHNKQQTLQELGFMLGKDIGNYLAATIDNGEKQ
jgi:hypothetical protein